MEVLMNRIEWSENYRNEAGKILRKINKLRTELRATPDDNLLELKRRIAILESMYRDCMQTAKDIMAGGYRDESKDIAS